MEKITGFIINHKKAFITAGIIICAVIVIAVIIPRIAHKSSSSSDDVSKARPVVMDLTVTVEGSGVIEPNDQYAISPKVTGDIESAPFEEGDQVKKGDLLYQFSTEDIDESIKAAEIALEQAELSYEDAVRTNEDAIENLTLTSTMEGYVNKLYVSSGDKINAGDTIADLYDNSVMVLTVPFNASDITGSWKGKSAKVYVGDEAEKISGTVKEVYASTSSTDGQVTKNVVIEVKNPGGITEGMSATAKVSSIKSASYGTFSANSEGTLTASTSGTILSLKISQGDYLSKNEAYAILEDTSTTDSVGAAALSVQSAQNQLDQALKNKEDYQITAPISGQVITKNAKEGDTINSNYTDSLALIYDLSVLKFKMDVDELDVLSLEIGQQVTVTSDAVENVTKTGTITNISLQGTTSNGVTKYPVTVELSDADDFIPGLNVHAEISIETVKDALCIPADALMRSNVVYVKDTGDETSQASGDASYDDIPEGYHAVSVTVGASTDEYVQILSGLSTDDYVYVPQQESSDYTMEMMFGDDYENYQ